MRKPVTKKPAKKSAAATTPKKLTAEEKAAYINEANEIFRRASNQMDEIIAQRRALADDVIRDMVAALVLSQRETALRDGYIAALKGQPVPPVGGLIYRYSRTDSQVTAITPQDYQTQLRQRAARSDRRTVWSISDGEEPGGGVQGAQ